ncbi:MAG: DUF308 domain-containing protein [Caldilineaceae bacterium]
MTAVAAKPAAAQPLGRPWWMTLILGIAAIIIGGLLLFGSLTTQLRTYEMLIVLIGIWWLVDGIMNIVHIFFDHRQWGWKLFMGIVGIIAGGWILIYPVYAGVALPQIFVLVLGIWGLIEGIALLVLAFRGGGWGPGVMGALMLILGMILIGNYGVPGWGLAMIWAAAVWMFIGGFFMVFRAFRERRV